MQKLLLFATFACISAQTMPQLSNHDSFITNLQVELCNETNQDTDLMRQRITTILQSDTESTSNTLLCQASAAGNIGLIQLLVTEYDADVNYQTPELGNTPLHFAVHNRHYGIVEFLLQQGANPNISNNTPDMRFNTKYQDNIICGTPLHAACWEPNLQALAINDEMDENATTNPGIEIIKLLLAYGANPNASAINNDEVTPLHITLMGRFNWEKLETLLQAGADPATCYTIDLQTGEKISFTQSIKTGYTKFCETSHQDLQISEDEYNTAKTYMKRIIDLFAKYA